MDLYLAVLDCVHREMAVPLPVGKRLVVGRSVGNDIVPNDRTISRRHFEVHRNEAGVRVTSLDARNWIYINGAPVSDAPGTPFLPGDRLTRRAVVLTLVRVDLSWLAWNDGAVGKMAQVIRDEQSFDRLPLLADALEDAGCTDEMILTHCRGRMKHDQQCCVLDLLLVSKTEGPPVAEVRS